MNRFRYTFVHSYNISVTSTALLDTQIKRKIVFNLFLWHISFSHLKLRTQAPAFPYKFEIVRARGAALVENATQINSRNLLVLNLYKFSKRQLAAFRCIVGLGFLNSLNSKGSWKYNSFLLWCSWNIYLYSYLFLYVSVVC